MRTIKRRISRSEFRRTIRAKGFEFDPQLFADNMNTTGSTGPSNDLSPELRTYYDRTLIERAKPKLVHDQFGQRRNIPKNAGQTINFRKFDKLAPTTTALTEGVTPDGSKLNMTKIEVTVKQYGAYFMLSDWLELTAPDAVLTEATEILGDHMGESLDTITRDTLMTGTNVYYGDGTVAARTAITADMKLNRDTIKAAVRALKRQDAPTFEGNTYVAIIHPDTWYDLAKDFETVHMYTESGINKIYAGELGVFDGVRFVETSRAKIYASAGAESADVYATLVLGKNAYAVTNIEGNGAETIAKQRGSGGTTDPLNQRATVGWKANRAVAILVQQNMIRVEHATSTNDHEGN